MIETGSTQLVKNAYPCARARARVRARVPAALQMPLRLAGVLRVGLLGGLVLAATAAAAGAGGPPYGRMEWAPSPLEYRGCYYYRGREHCGRYCYLEVNGRRYCQQRYREARPQAGPEHFFFPEPRPYAYGAPRYGYDLK